MSTSTPPSTPKKRIFDCPWCGAINPVPGDHMGEHFTCLECKKSTKLTEKNTSASGQRSASEDSSHLTGDRSFDCPWCGAISSVPSTHLGERFACPECKKETRLTSTNTRRSPMTAPPPEAPAGAKSGSKAGLLVVVGLVVVGGAVFAFLPKGGGDSKAPAGTSNGTESSAKPVEPTTPAAMNTESAMVEPAMTTEPAMSTPVAPPTPPPSNTEPPKAVDAEVAKAMLAKAMGDLAVAVKAKADAVAKYDAWTADNPDIADMERRHTALREVSGEAKRLLAAAPGLSDSLKATPSMARTFDAAVVKFVASSTLRVAVVEEVMTKLHGESIGRWVAADWKSLEFHGLAYGKASAAIEEGYAGMAGNRPPELGKAVADADAAIKAATKAKADAEAATAPPK